MLKITGKNYGEIQFTMWVENIGTIWNTMEDHLNQGGLITISKIKNYDKGQNYRGINEHGNEGIRSNEQRNEPSESGQTSSGLQEVLPSEGTSESNRAETKRGRKTSK